MIINKFLLERMHMLHKEALEFHYKDDLKKKKFEEPFLNLDDNETIVSVNYKTKEIYYTRHTNMGDVTSSWVYKGEFFDRVSLRKSEHVLEGALS
jgi:hydroxymethylpyrimidine pyrophosphatase-like HAD family hydrolase